MAKPIVEKERKWYEPKPLPEKKYYDVRIECTLPATLTFRVLAEDEETAIRLTKTMQPISVKHRLVNVKRLKATVLDAGSSIIRLIKNVMGT